MRRAIRPNLNCVMDNAMDGCAYRSLRLSTSGLSPSGILLYCRQRYCFVRPVARMASARQSRSYNRRFQLTSERTHRIYLLYPANGDIGAQVLGHEGYFGSYPYPRLGDLEDASGVGVARSRQKGAVTAEQPVHVLTLRRLHSCS